jgi:hypothetical protein
MAAGDNIPPTSLLLARLRAGAVYIVLPSGRKFFALCGRHLSETTQDDAITSVRSGGITP